MVVVRLEFFMLENGTYGENVLGVYVFQYQAIANVGKERCCIFSGVVFGFSRGCLHTGEVIYIAVC